MSATYTAPGQIPAANPVAVSVDPLITPLGGHPTKVLFVSNITVGGCSLSNAQDCTWTGTSSAANSHWKATARVTWKWQKNNPYDPSIAIYVPVSGTVALTDLQPNCQVDREAHPIGDDANSVPPSQLAIDYSTDPPTVNGTGTNLKGWTESCDPPQNPPLTPGAVWWADAGSSMSADGLTIQGNTTVDEALSSSWNFTAN